MKKINNKKSEIKESGDDVARQGANLPSQSSSDFSVADINPFQTSTEKIINFIDSYYEIRKEIISFEILQGYNQHLPYSFTNLELIDIYDKAKSKFVSVEANSTLSFKELMEQEYPKARFVIEPFFESGTVNMVSAPPNTWKSWLLFYLSFHIAAGTQPFDHFNVEQSKVMIVNEEDSFRAIQDRFKLLGVDDLSLNIYFRVANGSKLENKFITSLLDELKEKDIKVVIFDSLRSMHEADENDSTAMQKILDQMKRISREGITVIFTHHHRKKGMFEKTSSAESSRGSSAINAAISGHLSLDEEERETGLFLVIRHLKSKAGEKLPPFELKIVKDDDRIRFEYEGEFKQAEKKIKQTKDQIMELLSDGKWKSKKDFDESIKASKTVLHQALQSLKNDGVVLCITRKEAITKRIPVTEKGKVNELYYSINTESTAEMIRTDEEVADQKFEDF